MIDMDTLRDHCHPLEGVDRATLPTFRVDRDDAVEPMLGTLIAMFGDTPSLEAASIVIADEFVGYLERQDLYAFLPTRDRGIGEVTVPGYSSLPGRSGYRVLTLYCPVDGCAHSPVFTILYDEDDPLTCDLHPDSELEFRP